MVKYFDNEASANAAIKAAIASGHCKTGHTGVRFLGGRAVYTAHVQDGCVSWCLR